MSVVNPVGHCRGAPPQRWRGEGFPVALSTPSEGRLFPFCWVLVWGGDASAEAGEGFPIALSTPSEGRLFPFCWVLAGRGSASAEAGEGFPVALSTPSEGRLFLFCWALVWGGDASAEAGEGFPIALSTPSGRGKDDVRCKSRRPPQVGAASCCHGGTDDLARREATVGEPNQSSHNKEQQDFVPRPFMRGLLESKHMSKIAKRVKG